MPERREYRRPTLTRYRRQRHQIDFYQTTTGAVNSIQCANPDLCTGGEGAALPPWLLP